MPESYLTPECVERFSDEARKAVYDVIALRRDVRHFRSDGDVDAATLLRVLGAAHRAPSVGFSQPWAFVVVRERETRARIRESFLRCRDAEAARYPADRRDRYLAYRLEGILQAPVSVCVAVDLRPRDEAILGTTAQPEAVRASACCAVQNLWLAARAEGLGVGWVSIVEPAVLRAELALPAGVEPVAFLCVGHPVAFRSHPMLEEVGWRPRHPLASAIHRERWATTDRPSRSSLASAASGVARPARSSQAAPRFEPDGEPVSPERGLLEPDPRAPGGASDPVPRFDDEAAAAAVRHQDELTKPPGSLGRLEELATWYAGVVGHFPCAVPEKAAVVVFAADHGVAVEAVSAYSSALTAAMVRNVMAGGAAINALAQRHRIGLVLVDVGVAGDLVSLPQPARIPLTRSPIRAGTRNMRHEPAMSRAEVAGAIGVGARIAERLFDEGVRIVGTGEIGIGNTTAAAALVSAMTGASPALVVGLGTGIDEPTRLRKLAVVRDALARHALDPRDPIGVLAAVGGLELAATVGLVLRAASRRLAVVLDGFLAAASALVVRAIRPEAIRFCVASHASAERGHELALDALGLRPLLSLSMRLGEGTGAVLGIELVRSAVALQSNMATHATAGVMRVQEGVGEAARESSVSPS